MAGRLESRRRRGTDRDSENGNPPAGSKADESKLKSRLWTLARNLVFALLGYALLTSILPLKKVADPMINEQHEATTLSTPPAAASSSPKAPPKPRPKPHKQIDPFAKLKKKKKKQLETVSKRVHGENVEFRLGPFVVGRTAVPYICATLDWWPATKCDHSGCPWEGASVLNLGLEDFLSSKRRVLVRALRALGPVALRVGGSLQDLVAYDMGDENPRSGKEFGACSGDFEVNLVDRVGFKGGCMTRKLYDAIDSLVSSSPCRCSSCKKAFESSAALIFGVSGLHGRERSPVEAVGGCAKCTSAPCAPCWDGDWNATAGGARALLEHMRGRAAENRSALAGLSLGNELCGIGGIAGHLRPEVVGRDFLMFSRELDRLWGTDRSASLQLPHTLGNSRPLLAGPDCQLPLDSLGGWFSRFLPATGGALDALAYHLYWLGSSSAQHHTRRKLIDRDLANDFKREDSFGTPDKWPLGRAFFQTIREYGNVVKGPGRQPQMWVSETGGAYGSGAPNVTDRFISAFWYLDELGEMAKSSVKLHCRQTLVGGRYELLRRVGDSLVPNPDFFASRLWSELMGPSALKAVIIGEEVTTKVASQFTERRATDARAYAHCHATREGDVVILIINSSSRRARRINFKQLSVRAFGKAPRLEYHVTPASRGDGEPDLEGRLALLNGELLLEVDSPLKPLERRPSDPIIVEPTSYAFIVLQGVQWRACLPRYSKEQQF